MSGHVLTMVNLKDPSASQGVFGGWNVVKGFNMVSSDAKHD